MTGRAMPLLVAVLALLLLGCGGVRLRDCDCRQVGCPPGWECLPDPQQVSKFSCVVRVSESGR